MGLKSTPDVGSTFWFVLPLQKVDAGEPSAIWQRVDAAKHILLLGLHPGMVQAMERLLTYWGFKVDAEPNAANLVQHVRDAQRQLQPIDLVFVSSDTDGMEPETLIENLQTAAEGSQTDFVLLYPLGDIETATKTDIPGLVATMSQPIRTKTLVRILRQAFGLSGADLSASFAEKMNQLQTVEESLKILLVEDVHINVMVATAILSNMGHNVDVARNGRIALEKLRQDDYDLVLMDCQMPEMDGYECTTQLRDPGSGVRNPKIPVIAMTAHALTGDREKCLDFGMDDYVAKPINRTHLMTVINRWAGRQSGIPQTTG